ncbi:MAG: hypothetical protein ACRDWV_03000 [Acidimicrobiales bacterium]
MDRAATSITHADGPPPSPGALSARAEVRNSAWTGPSTMPIAAQAVVDVTDHAAGENPYFESAKK